MRAARSSDPARTYPDVTSYAALPTQVGGRTIVEYWIPAEDLPELNANIVGLIEVVAEYHHDYRAGRP